MALFRYVTSLGTFEQDTFPSSGVYELTLQRNAIRFQKDGIRSHESHPLHEKAMNELPTDLTVLRMDGTKVRTFPTIPKTLEELYAECNYFLRVPDLSYATNLQVMNLCDGRIEIFEGALPPNLHTLDVRNNALRKPIVGLRNSEINARVSGNPMATYGIKNQHAALVHRIDRPVAKVSSPIQTGMVGNVLVEIAGPNGTIRPAQVAPLMNTILVGSVLVEKPDPSAPPTDDFPMYTGIPTIPAAPFGDTEDQGDEFHPGELARYAEIEYERGGLRNRHRPRVEDKKTVYENTQNVHDSGVQDSTSRNISYLMERAKNRQRGGNAYLERMDAAIKDFKARDPRRNLVQKFFSALFGVFYSKCSTVLILETFIHMPYAMHGVSFRDLLEAVWIRIESEKNPETKDELIRRLREEVSDGQYRCTGGMMVRLCNIFIGFDENIKIELRPNDILQSRVPATMARVRKEMKLSEDADLPTEYWIKCFKETENDLKEVKLDEIQWRDWLEPIFDPIAPELLTKLKNDLGDKWPTQEMSKIRNVFTEFGVSYNQWMMDYVRRLN
jgi:hypothetical protein